VTYLDVELYVIASDEFYQAFPRVGTTSDKHWDGVQDCTSSVIAAVARVVLGEHQLFSISLT